jgi:outer membrane protein TolC
VQRLLILLALLLVGAISPLFTDTILEDYVREGIKKNLALKQRYFDLKESTAALQEARRTFFPTLTLSARHTWAQGGRSISIPTGDMLGEIYTALNLVTPGSPYPTTFEDQSLPVAPEQEQETKLSLIQPLVVPQIWFNLRMKASLQRVRETEILIYTRLLIEEIKTAYFNHLKARAAVGVYDETLTVLRENLRVSQKLTETGKATEEIVFRARAEIADSVQQKTRAEKEGRVSASYFNFLLQRPLDTPILAQDISTAEKTLIPDREALRAHALSHRQELWMLQNSMEAQDQAVWMARSAAYPEVSAAFDYGFQSEDYRFTFDDDFWSATIILEWDLFTSLQNRSRIEQAEIRKSRLKAQLLELRETITLEVDEAYEDLLVALKALAATDESLVSSKKYFEIIAKKYEEGISSQMEYMDARRRLTNAEIRRLISEYDYFIKRAHLESSAAISGGLDTFTGQRQGTGAEETNQNPAAGGRR